MYEDVESGEDCEGCQNTDNTSLYDWDGVESFLCYECAENFGAKPFHD